MGVFIFIFEHQGEFLKILRLHGVNFIKNVSHTKFLSLI
jgi:hypothetical protein